MTHSVGALPRAAMGSAYAGFIQPWMERGGDAWPAWLDCIDRFRAALAALLGGHDREYCPQPNLSAALAKLLPALPKPPAGKRVWLASEEAFPSLGFVLQQALGLGYELRLLPRSADPGEVQSWDTALTPDVCGALITHVHSNNGVVSPVAEITRLCAARGIWSIVDVAQSAGILPLSVETLGADVVLGSCVKWLCGGPGAGFLWLRAGLIPELKPVDVGWFSHADPFEMDIHSFRYAEDARRFWGGTPSVAPYAIATAGLELLARAGIDAVLAHNRALIQAFLEAAPDGLRGRVRLEQRGGTLCIPVGEELAAMRGALEAAQLRFDCRGAVVRLSFHLCNTMDDARVAGRAWPR
ncbi:MAG TPA: aminotransferase class V-fold PLP-dependent enzyme [Steroidobacteraceae bacterium]|nr:aminotransferase class V-fold PLP-dependent enzyme [Steroidobacteraceae bacterium]